MLAAHPIAVSPGCSGRRRAAGSAGRRGSQLGEHRGLPLERLPDVGFQLDIGLAATGRMVDAREQLQAMRVEREGLGSTWATTECVFGSRSRYEPVAAPRLRPVLMLARRHVQHLDGGMDGSADSSSR